MMREAAVAHLQHYAPGNVESAIEDALTALTGNGTAPALEALAGLDQFHTGGLQATRILAEQAAITAEDQVLDVGGGIGGPARLLAGEIGCHVTVLDLTEAYCRAGERITAAVGMADRVRFQHGDATDLPFADGTFDVVWTQHSSMNIADKQRLYSEAARVLRPGGRLAIFEVVAGPAGTPFLPTPWARSEMTSFLVAPDVLRATLVAAGLREVSWRDQSAWGLAWLRQRLAAQPLPDVASNTPGLQLLLGSETPVMVRNLLRNLAEERIGIVEAVYIAQVLTYLEEHRRNGFAVGAPTDAVRAVGGREPEASSRSPVAIWQPTPTQNAP
jgi:SAM-dependent methyltransferase